jgi:hypothetical protein
MKLFHCTAIALALAAAFPAQAQSNAEILKELQALKDKVAELEGKLKAQEAKTTPAPAATAGAAGGGQWGMTPEQARELNRATMKAEATEDALESQGLKMLKISGFIDPTYIYNQRQDQAGFQLLNGIPDGGFSYDNSFFGMAWIDFQKEMEGGTKWRLTLSPNRGSGAGSDSPSIVHEATVSIPLTDLQTRFIAGQLPDWSGYEMLQPTLNKLITHNLLFDYTLPFAYTGAGMEYVRGKWWSRFMVANVNASKRNPGETAPAFAYRVDYSRGEFQGFGFAGVHGKAANFSENVLDINGDVVAQPDSRVDLFEIDGYFIRGDWTVQGQLSYGQQAKASITADPVTGELRDARWYGASALAAYKVTPQFELTGRLDYINNSKNGGGLLGYSTADSRSGIGPAYGGDTTLDPNLDPNKGADRSALSLGLSYRYNLNATFKAEARYDSANLPVFLDVKTGEYRKSNTLLGTSVVVSF